MSNRAEREYMCKIAVRRVIVSAMPRRPLLLLIFLISLSAVVAAQVSQQNAAELNSVISRASDYATQYEADLGNLIGNEDYVQTSVWLDNGNPPRVARRMQRRSQSDFLIIQVGMEWAALRKVNRVDGLKVKEAAQKFEEAFDDSPQANAKRLQDMKKESTEYNLGDVQREINLPTFALKVLRKDSLAHFSFERAGTAKIDGVQTWKIRFREEGEAGTLVVGAKGERLVSYGTLWIEPETGRVLQTEFEVENPYTKFAVKGRSTVTYGAGKKVQILVPAMMVEHYESTYHTVDCRADYSNFRPFEVDVKFEIGLPQQ
jgi:hypothetical protein